MERRGHLLFGCGCISIQTTRSAVRGKKNSYIYILVKYNIIIVFCPHGTTYVGGERIGLMCFFFFFLGGGADEEMIPAAGYPYYY